MTGCFLCGNTESNAGTDLPKPSRPCTLSGEGQCFACEKVAKIDAKIRQLHSQVTDLLKQRHELLPEINVTHDPIIHRFPPELTTIIFEFCAPASTFKTEACEKTGREEVKAPLVLGSVCKGWREFAWSMPRLWTRIDLRLDQAYDREEDISVLSEWLSRSRTLPLAIHVHSKSDRGFRFSQGLKEFILEINRNYHRWEILDICTSPSFLKHFAGGTGSKIKPLPILRSLRLCMDSSSMGHQKFILKDVLPRPTEVALHRIPFSSVSIDWTQITMLRLGDVEFNDCVEIFKLAKALEHCKLSDTTGRRGRFRSSDPPLNVTSPFLQELELDVRLSDNALMMCEILTLPALVSLSLECRMETRFPDSITALLKRSFCQLRSLSLSQAISEPADLSALLREIPSLQHLSYESSIFWGGQKPIQFLGDLTVDTTNSSDQINHLSNVSQGLLPNLLSLVVDIRLPWDDVEWDQFTKLVRLLLDKENAYNRPLRKLHLGVCLDSESDTFVLPRPTVLSFLSCIRAGADLRLLGKYRPHDSKPVDLLQLAKEDHNIKDVEVERYNFNLSGAIS